MAKNKNKTSAGVEKSAAASKSKDALDENFISFDAGTLASLTKNIEARLKGDNNKKNNKGTNGASEKKGAKGPKSPASKPSGKGRADKPVENSRPPQKSFQGKKRDRNGAVIEKAENKEKTEKAQKAGKPQKTNSQDDDPGDEDDVLRKEILALGGSKEDFDLLAGVDSDEEVEGSTQTKPSSDEDALRKELSKLLKGSGQYQAEIPDDQVSEEEEEDDDDDEEKASDEEEDKEESEAEEAKESASDVDSAAENASKKSIVEPQQNTFPKEYSRLTIMPRSDWYNAELPAIAHSKADGLPRFLLERIKKHAVSLLEKENELYAQIQQKSSSSSHKFYSTIMNTGTLSDKISALTLAVQESPIHSVKSLENLVALSKKRSRAQAVDVLRSLKDLFAQGTLLPGNRKLKAFGNHGSLVNAFQNDASSWTENDPLPGGLHPAHLIFWAFEDYLKEQFFEVLKVLETWCNDEIEFSRTRAVSYVYELLKEKPEQEANLLRLLVNKLGDPGKKIASRASFLLLQLGQAHPLMKPTLIKAVEEFLFRPGQGQQAKYYAIITLNQTILSAKEEQVALQLLEIYFSLFVTLLKPSEKTKQKKHGKATKEEQSENDDQFKEKLVSAVLAGVNRAYPFTTSDNDRVSKHIDTLFRITHSSNFNTSIQALMLIQQLSASHQIATDRFYRTLYESLLDPRVATSSKQSLYLNLLYKALKNDTSVKRIKAFVKRIVQVLGLHQPAFICGVFFLIRELEKSYPSLASLYDQPEADDSDDEEVFRDVPDEDDEEQPAIETNNAKKVENGYDPRKRDPQHSNADKSCLWEMVPYLAHFHPSVSVSADHLLSHEPLTGKPDLTIHTLTHFLDRFIYRNAKASVGLRGSSIMQPLAGSDSHDLLVNASSLSSRARSEPLNSEAFWRKQAEEVAAEDVFFHEYFNRLGKDKHAKKSKKSGKAGDDGDEDGSDNESEIWQALVESRPELEGDDDDDDLDMDDLESDYDKDEDDEEEDGGVIFNDASDDEDEMEDADEDDEAETAEFKTAKAKASNDHDEDEDEDDFDMDVSDEEAFLDSDEDVPSDFEVGGVEVPSSPTDKDAKKKKKRKLRHLPTFASADDYAALLADEDDGLM